MLAVVTFGRVSKSPRDLIAVHFSIHTDGTDCEMDSADRPRNDDTLY